MKISPRSHWKRSVRRYEKSCRTEQQTFVFRRQRGGARAESAQRVPEFVFGSRVWSPRGWTLNPRHFLPIVEEEGQRRNLGLKYRDSLDRSSPIACTHTRQKSNESAIGKSGKLGRSREKRKEEACRRRTKTTIMKMMRWRNERGRWGEGHPVDGQGHSYTYSSSPRGKSNALHVEKESLRILVRSWWRAVDNYRLRFRSLTSFRDLSQNIPRRDVFYPTVSSGIWRPLFPPVWCLWRRMCVVCGRRIIRIIIIPICFKIARRCGIILYKMKKSVDGYILYHGCPTSYIFCWPRWPFFCQ